MLEKEMPDSNRMSLQGRKIAESDNLGYTKQSCSRG